MLNPIIPPRMVETGEVEVNSDDEPANNVKHSEIRLLNIPKLCTTITTIRAQFFKRHRPTPTAAYKAANASKTNIRATPMNVPFSRFISESMNG